MVRHGIQEKTTGQQLGSKWHYSRISNLEQEKSKSTEKLPRAVSERSRVNASLQDRSSRAWKYICQKVEYVLVADLHVAYVLGFKV